MEPHQSSSSFLSLRQLLEELDNLISLESSKNDNSWICVTTLNQLFYKKYGARIEAVAQTHGYSGSLRSLFTSSGRYFIYGTPVPHKFYLAPRGAVVPGYAQAPPKPIQYRIKRPWKVDGWLLKMLKAEGASFQQAQERSECQPITVSEIQSVDDLKVALTEIIQSLTTHHPQQIATVAALGEVFRDLYGQPIRSAMRSVCPDTKLIDLLQTIPTLRVQQVDQEWQITLDIQAGE